MNILLILAIIIGFVIYNQFKGKVIFNDEQVFTTLYGSVELTFPAGWFKNPDEHPFDLQCISKDEGMNTGVFQFSQVDFADDFIPKELLQIQVDDMKSIRKNFIPVSDEKTIRDNNKSLTTVVYSGDKGISKCYYRFTYITFDKNPDIHLVILQITFPSTWINDELILDKITRSTSIKSIVN